MKKTYSIKSVIHFVLIVVTTILFVITSSTFAQTGRIENVVVHSQALEGNLLGDSPDRNVSIYLPSAYDSLPTARFSVIYMLHGYFNTNLTFINFFGLKTIFDNFFNQGTVQPMIIVIPDAYNDYRGSWYTNSIVTGNWEDFITQELVEYVDTNYRTWPDSLSRGISGFSMGGYGAMKLAMKHPEIYSAVYSLSGVPLDFDDVVLGTMFPYLVQAANATSWPSQWEVQMMIAMGAAFAPNINPHPFYCDFPIDTNGVVIDSVWQRWLQHDPYSMIDTYKNNLLQLDSIVFDCGTLDYSYFSANQNFDSALTAENIPHTFLPYPGGHLNKIPERVEDHMLPFFSEILIVTDVESDHLFLPDEFSLFQNYPNPFNPNTKIRYSVPQSSNVVIKVFDILGNEIAILVNEEKAVGYYELEFNATALPSGIYFYQLNAGEFINTKKMILIK